ncbi:MAG: carbohydrate ABC transporter permease [Paenibacillaceae bacterium]|nr:carbohydrate ABC transporter permease [Paenibacillaceae bacterium]
MLASKRDGSSVFATTILYAGVSAFAIACLLPFVVILAASLSEEHELVTHGYWFWPRLFSWAAYRTILSGSVEIAHAYLTTIVVTVVGTALSVLMTLLMAYPLSRKAYKYRRPINFFMVITLLFNGGMVPWYIVCTKILGLSNNYAALIVPYLLNAWYVFILKSFLATISESLEESARIDGAGNWKILFRIVFPLSLPGIATIALFTSLGYWNDWWLALMLTEGDKLVPLQFYLMRIIQYVEFVKSNVDMRQFTSSNLPYESIRMALCMLAIGPIIFAYPFFQRYFIRGLTVGSLKG